MMARLFSRSSSICLRIISNCAILSACTCFWSVVTGKTHKNISAPTQKCQKYPRATSHTKRHCSFINYTPICSALMNLWTKYLKIVDHLYAKKTRWICTNLRNNLGQSWAEHVHQAATTLRIWTKVSEQTEASKAPKGESRFKMWPIEAHTYIHT